MNRAVDRGLPGDLLLVALGGAAGSLLRWAVAHVLPGAGVWHWPTFAVNVTGALLLGVLLEALTRPGTEGRAAHTARLLLGTGVLGGFTTYSTFAGELWEQVRAGATGVALGYAGLMLVSGLLAAAAGVLVGSRLRRRGPGAPEDPRQGTPGPAQ
ncbi:fluoride efflux transporter FluC [Kocuria tytonis]|uniref:Fluoride-specific ion channel FluC n=1 Tax=Kocuria tytonis TaxID=2054280 RepID=A0A495AD91_9MICC|nr:CrcB family protein [Kocuria tytonis]RKQ36765.1 CrcB family protein [Kocuria tytonis]